MRKALCREMLEIRYELLKIIALEEIRQLKEDLIASVKAGFDPFQAPVPAGNPNGGQWTDNGFGGWRPSPITATERLRRVDPPIEPSYVIENTLTTPLIGRALFTTIRNREIIRIPKRVYLTGHGSIRTLERIITNKQIRKAIETATKNGKVTTKIGKYGTPQKIYKGSNGITVVMETAGRNQGKIITTWRD